MTVSEIQIQLYALTKQLMELSEKYTLTTLPIDKKVLSAEINLLYEKLNDLGLQLKNETK